MQKLRKFEKLLIAGEWQGYHTTQVFIGSGAALGLIAGAAVIGAGTEVYGAITQAGVAGTEENLANTQANRQATSFNQLQALINNPASFFQSPVYQAAFNQGTQAVSRAGAAAGQNNTSNVMSGGQATALQAYGQSFGEQQLYNQEQLLAGMSGTGYNPASSLQAASGASQTATGNLNSLAGLLSFFGTSGIGSGGGGGASTIVDTGVSPFAGGN